MNELVDLTGDELKAREIIDVVDVVSDFAHFRSIVDLGFQVHHSEFDFEKIMIFSWIKEGIDNGRKN
jgi:hypothetical protein